MPSAAAVASILGLALLAGIQARAAEPPATPAPGSKVPAAAKAPAARPGQARQVDWEELIPADQRAQYAAEPPPPIHDYLGEGGMAAQQPLNFAVNRALDGTLVRIPGFIVPLDVGADGAVGEFFLVPYFGACIHVPPPPPNQIVYVRAPKGMNVGSIYEAYWITGQLTVAPHTTRLGAAAYSLVADKVELYKY